MEKIILDLCGGTGSWNSPYKKAGYNIILVTLPDEDVRTYIPPDNVYGILAAPPCTHFSMAGYRPDMKRDFEGAMKIVDACRNIIKKTEPTFWAIENPVGYLKDFLGKPIMKFQPWWFGDPWTKYTYLWGRFKQPKRKYLYWNDVPKIEGLYVRPGRRKPSLAFLHKSAQAQIPQLKGVKVETDATFRAITPPGFAKAFFEANK